LQGGARRGLDSCVSTITAILEPDADGTVHLPLPSELRNSRVRVTATLEAASDQDLPPSREAVLAALGRLRARGTFRQITDPVAWQREIRKDRPLPGRRE
jgi:hypothetical protein